MRIRESGSDGGLLVDKARLGQPVCVRAIQTQVGGNPIVNVFRSVRIQRDLTMEIHVGAGQLGSHVQIRADLRNQLQGSNPAILTELGI